MRRRYKYLFEAKPGYWYVRKGGRYVRVQGQPGTEEFDDNYWLARKGSKAVKPSPRSWEKLINSYQISARWVNLKPRTQKDYQKVLSYLIEKIGKHSIGSVERRHIVKMMEANIDRTRFANYIQQVLSILFDHAIDIGWTKYNPAKGMSKILVPTERQRKHIVWPDWAIEKFRAEAKPLQRLIFEVGLGTVQRPSDWIKMKWADYDGEGIWLEQGKTDKGLFIPCTERLKSALDAARRDTKVLGETILTDERGKPLNYDRLYGRMRTERERLGLMEYDLHALRYRGVQELAEAGCTDDEIASYSGHTSKEMIAKYAGAARQKMRARQAREKRR